VRENRAETRASLRKGTSDKPKTESLPLRCFEQCVNQKGNRSSRTAFAVHSSPDVRLRVLELIQQSLSQPNTSIMKSYLIFNPLSRALAVSKWQRSDKISPTTGVPQYWKKRIKSQHKKNITIVFRERDWDKK
jgi:hypothetical protein